jgi:hypothetical protein
MKIRAHGSVWIERQTTNLNVGGSNPPGRANKKQGVRQRFNPLFVDTLTLNIRILLSPDDKFFSKRYIGADQCRIASSNLLPDTVIRVSLAS